MHHNTLGCKDNYIDTSSWHGSLVECDIVNPAFVNVTDLNRAHDITLCRLKGAGIVPSVANSASAPECVNLQQFLTERDSDEKGKFCAD